MRDRSLEEFVDSGADPEAAPATNEGGDAASETGEAGEPEPIDGSDPGADAGGDATGEPDRVSVEPVGSTFEWTPGGVDCARCDAAVERRWRENDELVCSDCKTW